MHIENMDLGLDNFKTESSKPEVKHEAEEADVQEQQEVREPQTSDDENHDNIEAEVNDEQASDTDEFYKVEAPKDKLKKLKGEKYRALGELKQVKEENEQLQRRLTDLTHDSTYYYGKSAIAELEQAEAAREAAMLAGDYDALRTADRAYHKAMYKVNELENLGSRLESQQSRSNNYESSYNENEIDARLIAEKTKDWLEDHPELNRYSSKYNSAIAESVADWVSGYDEFLAEKGKHRTYYTDEYFTTIDKYIASLPKGPKRNTEEAIANSNGFPVRNSYAASNNQKASAKHALSEPEKLLAEGLGMTEAQWKKMRNK